MPTNGTIYKDQARLEAVAERPATGPGKTVTISRDVTRVTVEGGVDGSLEGSTAPAG